LLLTNVTLPLSKTFPDDGLLPMVGTVVLPLYAMASEAASLRVTFPLQTLALGQPVTVKLALTTTPFRDKVPRELVPATIAYEPAPSAKTVLMGLFEPVSVSTAKVWEAGTVSAADQLIVQPVPVPVTAEQVVVEPAALAAPSMNTAAWVVAAETYAGFRALFDAPFTESPIFKVPLTCWTVDEPGVPGELLFEPPLEQAARKTAVPIHVASARIFMEVSFLN
jgi:hypothetical protein